MDELCVEIHVENGHYTIKAIGFHYEFDIVTFHSCVPYQVVFDCYMSIDHTVLQKYYHKYVSDRMGKKPIQPYYK